MSSPYRCYYSQWALLRIILFVLLQVPLLLMVQVALFLGLFLLLLLLALYCHHYSTTRISTSGRFSSSHIAMLYFKYICFNVFEVVFQIYLSKLLCSVYLNTFKCILPDSDHCKHWTIHTYAYVKMAPFLGLFVILLPLWCYSSGSFTCDRHNEIVAMTFIGISVPEIMRYCYC